jgi:hypothetical protein
MPLPRASWPALALPVLASLYFPLAVAANVPPELLRLGDLGRPAAWTLAVSATTWLLAYLMSRSFDKAALASLCGVLAYSSLGWVVEMMNPILTMKGLDAAGSVGLLYAIAIGALGVALVATRGAFGRAVQFLTIMAALLVAWNLVAVARVARRPSRQPAPPVEAAITTPTELHKPLPDIYFIVLDKYSSSAVLASRFGLENSAFEAALRARGFVVPPLARANYVHTFLALAAMLNLRYLDELPGRFGASNDWELVYPLVENNRLVSFLGAHGYRIVTFPTEFGATRQNRYADVQLPHPRDVRSEVYAAWVHHTAGPVAHALICRVLGCESDPPPYLPASADLMDWRFRMLAAIPPAGAAPTFVFAHLLVPHEPYIYRRDCQHRPPFWPNADQGSRAARVRQGYVDQIRCVNTKLLQVIDSIQAHARVPPVILLQADHGHGRLGRDLPALDQASPSAIRERMSVFAAYALPGVPAATVPDSISPVNAARLVLRSYFGAELPPLPDQTFWSSTVHPYQFRRIH